MTLSTDNALVVPHPLGLDYHISLQTPYCILCRYAVRPGEIIAAVFGHWGSPSYLAYTLGFSFPTVAQFEYGATVYEKSRSTSYPWLFCRRSDCYNCATLHDTSIYHIDCFHIISKNTASKRPSLRDIWTIASWTESLPKTRYQAPPDITLGAVADETLIDDHESILARVCSIPQELRDIIAQRCPESPAWRLVSALSRWRIFQPLLDPDIEIKGFSFDDIKSWCRRDGMVAGSGGSGKIRIQLDDLGVSRLDYVNDSPALPTAASRSQNAWFVVEEVSEMQEARIETKGPFMRIHKLPSFHLWDTPVPPDPALTRWNREITGNLRILRIRSIALKDITGLTVFCQHGAVRWIYPHHEETFPGPYSYPCDNSPSMAQLVPSAIESSSVIAIFFPLAKGEKISSVWVRRCEPYDDSIPDTLAVITTRGRFQLFGKYLCPTRPEVHFQQLSGNNTATHLLFQDVDFPFQRVSYFAAVSASVNNTGISPLAPSQLAQSRGFSWSSSFCYVSIVGLENVELIWLFRRQVPEGTPERDRLCLGMMLLYEDGTLAAAGNCRQGPDIDVQVIMLPGSIHYKISHKAGGVAVECATLDGGRDAILGDEEGWQSIDMHSRSEMRFWFDDSRTIWITSPST
ncbi:uncharacterized protein TRIVIDRAFT_226907 [Trichoderma virens Gv29-8]|uniref:Uncharacterized protein n=1 Tax=Hypocrea virens (strain Gv29-8 / FGSC 10586) TaxID=413071 RepID=G9N7V3_HYPVG|nr:uncharacterized protein TRIVIDRAFT_226907 [Trichoderma virens Gv29-8]EHK17067.1 hypothetical protein TRIVIDRAFT_226907 [Trichoderma virens Gv29-8]UKZ55479.1 hypothetical protein TrVGV298_009303 [Trichoderma virens]